METPRANAKRVSLPVALLLATVVLLVQQTHSATTKTTTTTPCVTGGDVTLSLGLHTNATGHQQIKTRLERPSDCANWQLDVALKASEHNADQQRTQVLTLTYNGTPHRQTPVGYFPLPGQGLVRPERALASWAEARDACTAEGAALAMPSSLPQATALAAVVPFHSSGWAAGWAWLGATDIVHEGHFVSVKGIPLEQMGPYTWYSGSSEPNGGRSENCMVVQKTTGFLGDAPCDWNLTYVCQLDL